MYVSFEWNQRKSQSNLAKHHISFELAQHVFSDPNQLAVIERIDDGEERWQTIGMVGGCLILLVAHTTREIDVDGDVIEVIRIISARKADARERGKYETQKFG
ncbi:BrnT family toxin [Serratia proteamaculans]|uniref:BrnT family toxin n=1 Tax=Serratia proteamaculans TaxID=28151 RepID=UPI002178E8C7|nr:BrnT family toxin [Serratia proteamaculans]CAI1617644.1 Protein of uncharacterised function (DUF497) [Serratia proteamaculans]